MTALPHYPGPVGSWTSAEKAAYFKALTGTTLPTGNHPTSVRQSELDLLPFAGLAGIGSAIGDLGAIGAAGAADVNTATGATAAETGAAGAAGGGAAAAAKSAAGSAAGSIAGKLAAGGIAAAIGGLTGWSALLVRVLEGLAALALLALGLQAMTGTSIVSNAAKLVR